MAIPKQAQGFIHQGRGQGLGTENVVPPRFVDERPTFWLNPHEVSARRDQARAVDMAKARPRSEGGNL
jgi:hypothetical protein